MTYTYDTSSSDNSSRLTGLRYPGGAFDTLEYAYGSSGSIEDLVSRVGSIKENFSAGSLGLVDYAYTGSGMPVVVDYPEIGVQLAYDLEASGSGIETDGYPSLDRHGRVLRHAWISRRVAPKPCHRDRLCDLGALPTPHRAPRKHRDRKTDLGGTHAPGPGSPTRFGVFPRVIGRARPGLDRNPPHRAGSSVHVHVRPVSPPAGAVSGRG